MATPELLTALDVPVFRTVLGDASLREECARRLTDEADHTPGLSVSVVDGWHGVPDLAGRPDQCWQRLTGLVTNAVGHALQELARRRGRVVQSSRLHAQAWGVVLSEGAWARPHDHGDAHWSAVWYADAGDPPPDDPIAGSIRFSDPRRGSSTETALCTVMPTTGAALLFPGWLRHEVLPYRGTRPRVSVSYNVIVEPGG